MQDKTKIFNTALQLQIKGKFKEAQKFYLELIRKNIYSDKLFFFTGTSFLQTNEYDKAIKFLNKSIELNPNISEAYNNKGIALTKIQKFEESVENYNKAIDIKKDFFDAYLNKGISLRIIKKYREIIDKKKSGKNGPVNKDIGIKIKIILINLKWKLFFILAILNINLLTEKDYHRKLYKKSFIVFGKTLKVNLEITMIIYSRGLTIFFLNI